MSNTTEKPKKGKLKEKEKSTKSKEKPKSKLKMKKFKITGTFLMGDTLQKFEKEVEALGEKRAREKTFQDLGSRHRVKRSRILITSVEETR